ncbi:glycosyl-phosphatidylinositol-anchored molecule-like protein isoform X1 [Marmota flaviventris]|uniref:glycosyl-phosphatidylinositol-anchored molecule-like protein isoform X3 n=1 Tax=Marmota flaviventris TaxID=93162 RepID=UPI003A8A0CA0
MASRSKLLPYMMLPLFLLLFVGLPLVESHFTNVTKAVPAAWTFNVQCHECVAENTFDCPRLRTCLYDHRRCMTVAAPSGAFLFPELGVKTSRLPRLHWTKCPHAVVMC